ncbi:hypothetical protein R3P38DRAFT_3588267 [Favolaschia claudopus]|uniref:RNase H type-1 domain-containing protein n=1 Tax=Favolaschia claudopus TaxID=2862362 RepID=A0AAW0AIW7_9AGAR
MALRKPSILRAGVRLGYFPKSWRIFLTIALRKPGKSDYTIPKIPIGDIVIQPTETAKLLGVMLDFKLSFRQHVELAQARGTKATLALSRIATPTFGLPHSYMRQFFQSVVVPRMEYGLPVWYKPVVERGGTRRAGTVWVAKALGKVQRQACRLITGARQPRMSLTSTHTSSPSTYASTALHIMPPHALHLSLPPTPSATPSKSDFETIDPQRRLVPLPPGSFSTHIAADKDTARADMERITARGGMCIFTDGSGFDEGAGAAAVAMVGQRAGLRRQKYLGTLGEHTVFESEVCGAILALDIIADTPRLTDVDIFLDCQPALSALSSPKSQPGQYLLATFHAVLGRLLRTRRTLKVRLRWVPAHVGIAGNELVDSLAKEAAQGVSTALRTRIRLFESPLPVSRAAAVAAGARLFALRWVEEWRSSPRYMRIATFESPVPSSATPRMYRNLNRSQCSVLTQLRTGHIGLNAYLFRFHLAPSPLCPHCNMPESVPHLLLACPAYRTQRLRLFTRLGTARVSLRRLLSSKHDPSPVLAFVRDTRRLPSYAL